ncbi:MAG: glycoside hydrolase family 10 protein, partial [Actinomycetales bacterium]
VTGYDLDAVHFDEYFYPYGARGKRFKDAASYRAFGGGASLANWRRANVDALITELGTRIKEAKPWVQFGISPFAVWRNAATDPSGSATRAGVQTYDDLYADTRTWVRQGLIDYVAPQIYWTRDHELANYEALVRWWAGEIDAARANGHDVGLYVGEAAYRAGTRDGSWRRARELSRHLAFAARWPQVDGHIYFSAKDVAADRKRAVSRMVRRWYAHPALQPVIGRPPGSTPRPVADLRVQGGVLTWSGTDEQATTYAVYRIPGSAPQSCDLADARHLVATLRRQGTDMQWQDPQPQGAVTYVVTAVDRSGRESAGVLSPVSESAR